MSGIATGTALAIGLGATAAGSVASGIIGSNAAGNAATTQAQASEYAAGLQSNAANNALSLQQQEWQQNQANQAPFLAAGQQAVQNLSTKFGNGAPQWTGQFQAPTAAQAAATPGYQFALQQGEQAIQNSAAARGNLLTGGTTKALDQYATGQASQTYQQTFNNQLAQYQQAYNQFQQAQTNQYNQIAGIAGTGQVTANTLGQQGQQAATNAGNIYLTSGQQISKDLMNQAAATASGYVGQANAWSGGLSSAGNSLTNGLLMSSLLGSQGGGGGTSAPYLTGNTQPTDINLPPTGTPGVLGVVP